MTQKLTFNGPFDKPRRSRNCGRRLLVHFVLFTLLAVLLLGVGTYGRVKLHEIFNDQLTAKRSSILISEASDRVKAAAEAKAPTNALRTKISSGLSSKAKSTRTAATEMISAGTPDEEVLLYIVDTLSAAATSRLSADNEEQAALMTTVNETLAAQRDEIIAAALSATNEQISQLSIENVRSTLARGSKNYVPMFYSTILLIVGAVLLVLGLAMGAVLSLIHI